MQQQLELFKKKLEEFALKHRRAINKDPVFRKKFVDMCSKIGVDPLACENVCFVKLLSIAANKGFWSEFLGVGNFYYELSIQVADVCLRTRERNGGLIPLDELTRYLQAMRGSRAHKIS